jgi:hypothetical protein
MSHYLENTVRYPDWADARWRRLHWLDLVLEGKAYDALPYEFHQEDDGNGNYIPIAQRRPARRYNFLSKTAKDVSRKLFAGRHRPHFIHVGEDLRNAITGLCNEGLLEMHMLKATYWMSVGSVALTFRFMKDGDGNQRILYDIWRAKWCIPTKDPLGELQQLRIRYVTSGANFGVMGPQYLRDNEGEDVDPAQNYFFVRDFRPDSEITYAPVKVESTDVDDSMLTPREVIEHNFGFVPGVWICSGHPGGIPPDGGCFWEEAIPNMVDSDYTMSQMGRGIRYNAAPQLVIKGNLKNYRYDPKSGNIATIERDPSNAIHLEEGRKEGDQSFSGGSAELLETTGAGIKVGVESYVGTLRKEGLELIGGSRKDPDKLTTLQSGKAMENLDEEIVDLVAEVRTAAGDNGYLPLIRKSVYAAKKKNHELFKNVDISTIDELGCQWPRLFQPSAQEFLQFVQGLQALRSGDVPGSPTSGSSSATTTPLKPLVTDDEARALLEGFIDIPPTVTAQARQQSPVPIGKGQATPIATDDPEGGEEVEGEGEGVSG